MNLVLKKYLARYEYLKLELQDIDEKINAVKDSWIELVGPGKIVEKNPFKKNTESVIEEDTTPKQEKIKKIYKKLSLICHPDKGGNPYSFTLLKQFYDQDNLLELYNLAKSYNINIELDQRDEELLLSTCKTLENQIKEKFSTAIWMYYYGSELEKQLAIEQVRKSYGKVID